MRYTDKEYWRMRLSRYWRKGDVTLIRYYLEFRIGNTAKWALRDARRQVKEGGRD